MSELFPDTLRALDHERRHRRRVVGALGVSLLVVGGWLAWFALIPVSVHVSTALARLEADRQVHRVEVSASGRVLQVSVSVGQSIEAGEVMFVLDAAQAQLGLAAAVADRDGVVRQIEALDREIAALESALLASSETDEAWQDEYRALAGKADASSRLESERAARFERMYERGLLSTLDRDGQRAAAAQADAELRSQSARMRRVLRERAEKRAERLASRYQLQRTRESLRADVQTADATIAGLEARVEEYVIRAPVAGEVGELSQVRVGEVVSPGQHLASVVPRGPVKIVADFLPGQALGRVRPGQPARMHLDGFPSSEFGVVHATVARVSREARYGYVRVEFTVENLDYERQHRRIPIEHGLPGSIEVDVEEVTPALLLLRAAGRMVNRPTGDSSVNR